MFLFFSCAQNIFYSHERGKSIFLAPNHVKNDTCANEIVNKNSHSYVMLLLRQITFMRIHFFHDIHVFVSLIGKVLTLSIIQIVSVN